MLAERQAGQRTPSGQKIDANQRSAVSSSGNMHISSVSVKPLRWALPGSACAMIRAPVAMYHGLGRDESNCLRFAATRKGSAVGQCEGECRMGSGVAAEQDEMSAAGQGAFGCWTEGASLNVALGSMGFILATRIGGISASLTESSGCWIPSSRSLRGGSTRWTGS